MPKKPTSPAKINPPEGWKDGEGFGFLAALGADQVTIPLVRLHDLAVWLRQTMPLKTAVDTVCDGLTRAGLSEVYELDEDDYAKPYDRDPDPDPAAHFFPDSGKPTAEKLANYLRGAWMMPAWELSKLVNAPGLGVEFDESEESVFDFAGRKSVEQLAITRSLAHALFGWGTVEGAGAQDAKHASTDAHPVKKPKQHELAPDWTGQKLKERKAKLRSEGVKNFIAVLAKESNLPVREVSRRIKSVESPMGGMAAQLKAAG